MVGLGRCEMKTPSDKPVEIFACHCGRPVDLFGRYPLRAKCECGCEIMVKKNLSVLLAPCDAMKKLQGHA